MTVDQIAQQTWIVDLKHQGRASVMSTGVLEFQGGIGLVDPGPEVCLGALRAGLAEFGHALSEVRAIFLTHIHLDHATAAGAIAREVPEAVVYVHPRGATHMIDPTRLLSSAKRIYGAAMDTLWGEFLPVAEERVLEVGEGDIVQLGERRFDVGYVPGHAKHHVAYFEAADGTAWVGDVAGVRIPGGVPLPVTPPPDIDVEVWNASMDRVMEWRPARIVPAHFGLVSDPGSHFAELRRRLGEWAEHVEASLSDDDGPEPDPEVDSERAAAFDRWIRESLAKEIPEPLIETYAFASAFRDSWWGLARYWRKRAQA